MANIQDSEKTWAAGTLPTQNLDDLLFAALGGSSPRAANLDDLRRAYFGGAAGQSIGDVLRTAFGAGNQDDQAAAYWAAGQALWQDLFADTSAAPLAARTGFTISDAGNRLSTTGQFLLAASGGVNWGDTSIYRTASMARASLGCVAALVRFPVNASSFGLFLTAARNPANPLTADRGLYYNYPDLRVAAVTLQNTFQKPGTRLYMIDYLFCCFVRPGGGMVYAVSGGQFGAFPAGTIVWVDDDDTTDPVFAGIANGAGEQRVDYWRALSPASAGSLASRRFGQALGGYGFDTAVGNASGYLSEEGGKALEVWTGAALTSGGALQSTSSATLRARFDAGAVPRIWQAVVTTPATITACEVYIDFRDNGTSRLSAAFDTTHVYIFDGYDSTTPTQAGTVTLQPSTTYHLAVYDFPSGDIAYYVNDVLRLTCTSAHGLAATKGGITTVGAGMAVGELAAWPAAVTLPTALGGMLAPVTPTGSALVSDAFTDTAATALATHNANWSNQAYTGGSTPTYQIDGTGAKARQSGTPDIGGFAIWGTPLASADHSVSVDVTIPAAGGFQGAAVARWADNQNYIAARVLNQGGGATCEIETWQHVSNTTTLVVAAQIGALVAGDTHTLVLAVKGTVVSVYWDGNEVAKGTTTLTTGTKVGFGLEDNPSAGTTLFDNFAAKAVS